MAWYEDEESGEKKEGSSDYEVVSKFQGALFSARQVSVGGEGESAIKHGVLAFSEPLPI